MLTVIVNCIACSLANTRLLLSLLFGNVTSLNMPPNALWYFKSHSLIFKPFNSSCSKISRKFKKHHIIVFSGTCKQRDRRRLKTRRTHNIILRLVSKIATTLQNLKNIVGIPVYLVFRLLRENNSIFYPIFSLMGLLLLSTCPCVHRPDERLCS